MRAHGPWKVLSTRDVYRDPWIEVIQDQVIRPDGQPGTHCIVTMKAGVCVVALDEEDYVYLTEEFHYGVGRVMWEGVSGGIEPPESAEQTARRELAEELGIQATRWTNLGSLDPFTTIVVSPVELYVAEGLTIGTAAPEGTEHIRRVRLPLAEAIAQVHDSRITHGATTVILLKLWLRRGCR